MGERIRVLCFGRFFDAQPGGMQQHIAQLLRALGNEIDAVNLVPARDWHESRLVADGVPVIRTRGISLGSSVALSPGLVTEARRLHRAAPFDLIHLHFPDPMSHLAALALPRHIPRIITWHADITRQKRMLALYRPLLEHGLRQAAAIIVPTPAHIASSAFLGRAELAAKLEVVPFGFDLAPFLVPAPRPVLPQGFPARYVFALGRHVSYKGFEVLIAALAGLPADVGLVIGGMGPLTGSLKKEAHRLGVADRVHFPGLVPDDALPAYYQHCAAFCLPSVTRAEAFGIVQVEAMASGRPVVSTALGNGVDWVNQDGVTGHVVPPRDAEALAGALRALLADPEAAERMGARGRERAAAHFTLDAMGGQTLALYRKVLSA